MPAWKQSLGLAFVGASLLSACTVLPSSQLNPGRTSNRAQPGLTAGAQVGNLLGRAPGASLDQGAALAGAGIVASGGGNAVAGAGIVASGGGNAVVGAGIVAAGGGNAVASTPNLVNGGLLANDGVGLLANDGGGLVPPPAGLVANASGNGLIANDGGSYLGGRAMAVNSGASAYRLQQMAPKPMAPWREPIASATVQVFLQDGSAWGKAVAANADGYFAFPEQPPEGALAVATGLHQGKPITVRGPITRGTGLWVVCPGSTVALAILKAEGQRADQSLDATSFRAWADAICEAARQAPVDAVLGSAEGMKNWYEERLASAESSLGKLAELALASSESLTVSVGGGASTGAESTAGSTTGATEGTTSDIKPVGGSSTETTDAGIVGIKPGVQTGGRTTVQLD